MQALGRDEREALVERKAHLVPEYTQSPGPGAVTFGDPVVENMTHKLQVGSHEGKCNMRGEETAALIYVRESPQHGRGVFAGECIAAGTTLIRFGGPLLMRAQVDFGDYHLQVGDDLYLGPSGAADDFVNHSCAPNAGFADGLALKALRDIAAHEEITWDYSCAIDEADFPGFPCACGAVSCRGLVRSFRHLEPTVRERLRPWALPYLRDRYRP